MEFVRAGEALLRSSQPLLPFLAPSAYRSATPRRLPQCLRQHHPSRPLSTTTARRSEPDEFSKLLDETLDQNKSTPTAPMGRTSRFRSTRAQQHQRTGNATAPRTRNSNNSFDDILTDMRNPQRSPTTTTGPRNPRNPRDGGLASILDIGTAINPNYANPSTAQPPPTPPVKLNSTVGRTIMVDENRGMDVGRAFRTLEARCAQNSVKRDFMRQRFHERPGLKRKRLKSERWRRRFKEGFRATIKLVQGLKKQGW